MITGRRSRIVRNAPSSARYSCPSTSILMSETGSSRGITSSILLVPVAANLSLGGGWTSKAWTALFAIAGAVSIGIHFRGATAQAVHDWNGGPPSISDLRHRSGPGPGKIHSFFEGLMCSGSAQNLGLGSRRRIQAGHLPAPIVFRAGEVQEHICGALLGHGRSGSDFHTISVDGTQIDEHRWVLEEVVAVV
jgi:hypothetical protein